LVLPIGAPASSRATVHSTPALSPYYWRLARSSITVLVVKPVKFGRIFALASVEIDLDGVLLVIHGVGGVATGWARDFGARVNTPTEHTSG
jgi:hypothetical protein